MVPSATAPPGDIIGRWSGKPPGLVEIGGEIMGDVVTPGEMGYCWGVMGNMAGWIT
jgi:hypothetical protein